MLRRLIALLVVVLIAAACGGTGESRQPPVIDDPLAQVAPTDTPAPAIEPTTTQSDPTSGEDDGAESDDHDDGDGSDADAPDDHDDDSEDASHTEDFVPEVTEEPTAVFDVVLADIFFEPADIKVAAGQTVRFNLVNEGNLIHEFRLSNSHRIEEHIAAGHDDEGGHEEDADIVVTLEGGESRTIDVTFPSDLTVYTEVACLIPGHYEAGMKGVVEYQ